jgi:transposase InsO family protein
MTLSGPAPDGSVPSQDTTPEVGGYRPVRRQEGMFRRGGLAEAVIHTDHGAQYTSRAFADACRQAGVRQSMSAIGSSADNALAESFDATFKRETLQGRKHWPSEREARLDAFRRLDRYNTRRRHSRLGQRGPIAYETALGTTSTTLAQAA